VNTDAEFAKISARCIMILSYELAKLALHQAPVFDPQFHCFINTFVQPALTGTAANCTCIEPLVSWWHCALTYTAVGGPTVVAADLIATATPRL
jgi:hypothetical protein